MTTRCPKNLKACFLEIFLACGWLLAMCGTEAADVKKENTAVKPVKKHANRHLEFLKVARQGDIQVVFLGDSITDGWRTKGKDVWKRSFEPLKAANFGIGGDQTQHVIWRLQNGELEGYKAKAFVVMIGTNNLKGNSPVEIAQGIKTIVDLIRQKQPQAKVLLLGIFPRGPNPTVRARGLIKDVNERIAKFDDGKTVKYLDIGEKFLSKDGVISPKIMPDYLHLSEQGYQIWADAIKPVLHDMLKE